jgi:hypothetical protein
VTVTQPCVSVGTGTLSPDLRVFYQYGMVLGLDDFLQEQTHNLGLNYHHERALHGYGTVYGLHVTTSTPSDAPGEVTVAVEPGMAIDQSGREVTVTSAQCARLGAWLAAQEQASAGTVEGHLGSSRELVVYVVAAYAQCPDDLVPLPGQPCSTSAQVQVPSRLRDTWDIDFRWAPPAMPAWDAVRRLGQLLNSIQIVPGPDLSLGSDEEALIEAVLALPSPQTPSGPLPETPSGSPPGPITYRLPAADADAAFDRILTAWVTQVRPQLAPDLTAPDPAWDPAVLLSAITLTLQTPFAASSPVILSHSDPDDTGRPYLLHTGLIQELRLGGQAGAAPPALVQEAVTLSSTVDSDGVPTLTAWFHLADPVSLPPTIQVAHENGQAGGFTTEVPPGAGTGSFSEVWTLSAPPGSPPGSGFTVADGDQLAATFPGTEVRVGNSATTLAAAVAVAGQGFLNTTGLGDVTAYTTVRASPTASVPFVTASYIPVNGSNTAYLELWFHLQPQGARENIFVTLTDLSVQVVNDVNNTPIYPVAGESANPTSPAENVWRIAWNPSFQKNAGSPARLRLSFSTEKTSVNVAALAPIGLPRLGRPAALESPITLAEWINTSGIRYVGWEGATIVSFARIAVSPSEGSVGD